MEITTTPYKRCDLVQVSGRVDSFTAPNLSETMRGITDSGRYKITLDMSGVTYVQAQGCVCSLTHRKHVKL